MAIETKAVTVLRETGGYVEVEWEIQNFFDLPFDVGETLESDNFMLSNQRLFLQICPFVSGHNYEAFMSLYLRRCAVPGEFPVSAYLGIKTSGLMFKYIKVEKTFSAGTNECGIERFAPWTSLRDFLNSKTSYGPLTVVCKVRFLDGRLRDAASQTSQRGGLSTLSKNLEELFLDGNLSDVKVKAGGQEFEAHKVILTSRSPVFKAMFQHKMVERNSGVIEIPELESEHVRDFLLYLYTGKVDHVTPNNAFGLYRAADKYSLDELKEECRIRLANDTMSVDSVLDVILLATVHDEDEILENGTKFFINNAEEILRAEKWGIFHAQNATIANELIISMVKGFKSELKNKC